MQPVSMQRIGKYVSVTTNTRETIELLLKTAFSILSAQSGSKEDNWGIPVNCQLSAECNILQGRLRRDGDPVSYQ
jgi:hypothetical protein